MQPDSAHDRPFFLCELATILAVMASAPLVNSASAQEVAPAENSEREAITYDHVHGSKRLSLGGFPADRIQWLDDDRYLQRDTAGWKAVTAENGELADWYDRTELAAALQRIEGVSEASAVQMAAGGWIEVLHEERIVVFRDRERLIRMTLEGNDVAIVDGIPATLELSSLSPTGSGLAFVRDNEMWVVDFTTEQLRQLTFNASPDIRNGKADWVYFEEIYNRKWQAFRWSPDGEKLAFQQFNDADIPLFQISDHTTVEQTFEKEHYPKAGKQNPTVRLGIVSLSGGVTTWVDASSYPADDFILTHFQWSPDSSSLYWFAQNRIQTWLDICQASVADGSSRVLLRDQTAAWTENPGDLTFLVDGSFLFFSEKTGWRHLYHAAADGQTIKPVTSGEWEVCHLHAINADESFVIVAGTKESLIAEDIYRVPLQNESGVWSGGEPVRLSHVDGTHAATCSKHGRFVVDSWSSLKQPPAVTLRDFTGREVRKLDEPIEVPYEKYTFGKVELKDVPMADGSVTSAVFVYPPDFDEQKKYPVWLKTYAGPHSPAVKNVWSARLPEQLLANLGIVVITFDPRSASGYGAKSAWLAYRKLGVEETRDLVSVCDWLQAHGWADMSHIGLSGHSYGGYFTSYAMTHCNRICAGVAGAPVTDWANYDTIYTERFMSTPQDNPDGYRQSSVVESASRLNGRLLLLHGMRDDNVHPENTLQLAHALQEAGKQFDLMLYPTSRHGIHGDHYTKLLFNFMVEAMGKPEARQP